MAAAKYSRDMRFDAATFADEQKTCCMLPLRWGTLLFGLLFATSGVIQCFEGIYLEIKHGKHPRELLGGSTAEAVLIVMAVCMLLSGAAGLLGALFQIRLPVTAFCVLLLVQVILEIWWFAVVEGTEQSKGPFVDVASMLLNEILRGNRTGGSTTAGHLFYTLFSINFHFWATAVSASYALELKAAGKTVWFEPVLDDSDDEDEEAPLLGKAAGGAPAAEGGPEPGPGAPAAEGEPRYGSAGP